MSDPEILEAIRNGRDLRHRFLHPVLAKIGDSGSSGLLHDLRRVSLRHGDKSNLSRVAPSTPRRRRDSPLHCGKGVC